MLHYMQVESVFYTRLSEGLGTIEREWQDLADAAKARPAGAECAWWQESDIAEEALECVQYTAQSATRGAQIPVHPVRGAASTRGSASRVCCCRYCLYSAAGESLKTFNNSPWPRDHDKNGLRADRVRKGATHEPLGMRLDDFCKLRASRVANLHPEHVAALRIYSTAAFKVGSTQRRTERAQIPACAPLKRLHRACVRSMSAVSGLHLGLISATGD